MAESRRSLSSHASQPGGWFLVQANIPTSVQEGARGWLELADARGEPQRLMALGRLRPGHRCSAVVVLPAGGTVGLLTAATPSASSPIPDFTLRRLSRAAAFIHMSTGTRDGVGRLGLRRLLAAFLRMSTPLLLGRLRDAADILWAAYQAGLREGETSPLGAGCHVRFNLLGAALPAIWFPTHQMQTRPVRHDHLEFEAVGDDPQFRLERAGRPVALPAGWYQIECAVTIHSGRLLAPALYPDYGEGYLPQDMVKLPEPDPQGLIRTLVMFRSQVASLRFDPSIQRTRFAIDDFAIRRVGRLNALLLLLDRYRRSDQTRDWRGIGAALSELAVDTVRHGLSSAASRLHEGRGGPASGHNDYRSWVRLYDTPGKRERRQWNERAGKLAHGPLISILLPVYETPERLLRRCLDSVVAQAYPRWELCVVDDASPSPHVSKLISQYACRDQRIRFVRRDRNGHISAASNDALALATGAYVALLDHDDELRPHALLEVAEQLVSDPDIKLVYSDEDKIDELGHRFDPYFKPDWNPDLLLSQNYLCHFSVLATDTVRNVAGFRIGLEGSQDHDLFLRCIEQLRSGQIRHIPKVLYHWRAVGGSTALSRDAKDYASAAGAQAVADHLTRVAPGARAEELEHGHYRVIWPLPPTPPKVTLLIPTRDRVHLLRTCIDSVLEKTIYPDFEIIIVDNQSCEAETFSYFDTLRGDARIRVLPYDAPFNYSAINNWAARHASGEVLCLLNNDIEVLSECWLEEMVSQVLRPGIGAVGAMLYYPDRTIQHAGVILGLGGVANHIYTGAPAGYPGHGARALVVQNLSAVTGACLVVEKVVYEQLGGLDEQLQVAFNDIDFCLRLREAGYRNLWTPFAQMVHHESASRGSDESDEKRARFLGEVRFMEARWGELLHCDPAYNPNLSLSALDAGLAFPPRSMQAG